MKKFINTIVFIAVSLIAHISNLTSLFAQPPQAIPYQAVARNVNGNLIANQNVLLRFTIHDGAAAGANVYQEIHSLSTNDFGLFTANIGQGTVVSGVFAAIAWGTNAKYLQVEILLQGGVVYIDMGSNEMLSVPYALYAKDASHASNGINPGAAVGNTIWWNGNNWENDGNLFNNGSSIGIGTITPGAKLDVNGTIKIQGGSPATGKVLTSSNEFGLATWAYPPTSPSINSGFKSYPANVQVIPNSFLFPTNWSAEYDDGGNFAGGAYTAPANGVYHFDLTLTGYYTPLVVVATNVQSYIVLQKNGTNVSLASGLGDYYNFVNFNISTDLKLNAGDIITVIIYQLSGESFTFGTDGIVNSFSGHRVY